MPYSLYLYTEYPWEITRKSLLQLDGHIRISKVSCNPREIPIETSQKGQICQHVLQKQTFFFIVEREKCPLALCTS